MNDDLNTPHSNQLLNENSKSMIVYQQTKDDNMRLSTEIEGDFDKLEKGRNKSVIEQNTSDDYLATNILHNKSKFSIPNANKEETTEQTLNQTQRIEQQSGIEQQSAVDDYLTMINDPQLLNLDIKVTDKNEAQTHSASPRK